MAEPPNNSPPAGGSDDEDSFFPLPPKKWIEALRNYLRDQRDLNILLDNDFESTDAQLGDAWGAALMDWNATPPDVGQVSFANFPMGGRYALRLKAACEALKSASIFHARNELNYQDGNTAYSINDKWKNFMQLIDRWEQEYSQLKLSIKTQINMEQAWGGAPSEMSRGYNSSSGESF